MVAVAAQRLGVVVVGRAAHGLLGGREADGGVEFAIHLRKK